MKTVGQILKEARLKKKIEVEDVARITKIRPQFLQFIETDDYGNLPSATVTKGFIRNYCEFLNLSPDQVLAVFRRDFVEDNRGQIVPRGIATPAAEVGFWTPRTTIIAVITLVLTLFGAYLVYQYQVLTGPPELELLAPADKIVTEEPNLLVEGRTDPEATISVNGQLVALEKGGRFFFRIALHPGDNTITVVAAAKNSKTSTLTRQVTLR